MSTTTVTAQPLRFTEKIGYGFGDLASCLFWQTFTVFLLIFYTDVFGIAAAAAGTMIGVVRMIDLFADPADGDDRGSHADALGQVPALPALGGAALRPDRLPDLLLARPVGDRRS